MGRGLRRRSANQHSGEEAGRAATASLCRSSVLPLLSAGASSPSSFSWDVIAVPTHDVKGYRTEPFQAHL
ncbi:hypothetical protein FQA47_008044 [Oryzias melastigma]|nr:hypothetical protein FQA47_008044 [Oryzias melastigma]